MARNFNIKEFQGNFVYDGARPNLFQVTIPTFTNKLSFTCKAAQLPGSTLGTVEVPYMGRMLKLAGNRTFAEWTVTILNDEDFLVRNLLEGWMGQINGHATNVATALAADYTFDATVTQYGKQGDDLKAYKFVGMFPTDVAPIDLDWGSNDAVEEYSVTFAYQFWTTAQADVG